MSPKWIGFLRGIAYSVILVILSYLSTAANLTGLVPDGVIVLITGLAAMADHYIESRGSGALFGAVTTS